MRSIRAALALALTAATLALVAPAAQAAPTGSVSGAVTVTGGGALSTGYVVLYDPRPDVDGRPTHVASEETDARGRYRLAGVPAGRYDLATSDLAGRWAPRVVPVTVTRAGTVRQAVRLDRGRTITGRILRGDGTPAAGAEVYLSDEDSPYEWTRVTTADAAGRYTARALTAARHSGQVLPETARNAEWGWQCFNGRRVVNCGADGPLIDTREANASAGTVTLRHRNGFVTGTVRDLAGRGVAGLRVQILDDNQSSESGIPRPWQITRSDARGRYRLPVAQTDVSQFISVDRLARNGTVIASANEVSPVPALGRTATRDLRLAVGSTVTARTSSPGKGRATVRIRVAPRIGTGVPRGKVVVSYKKRNGTAGRAVGTLDRTGVVRVKLSKVRSGTRPFTLRYGGSDRSLPATTTVRGRVR